MKNNQYSGFEVAVIGMSIRTSGATNWREFWKNLIEEKESLLFLTENELIDAGMEKSLIKDKYYVNCARDIINKDSFDSKFFGYSNDEARMMYPGHRFFHECVWEALEDAGYVPENNSESIGIYAGAGDDIMWKSFVHLSNDNQKVNAFYLNTINNKDYLSTLISYKLGFTGPSMAINTACSTSLVAIHTACKALIFGETKIALAGASSLINSSQKGYIYEEGSIFSKDGHCKAFDKDSTGTVDGEGTGVVVLKRLKDAIQDKDNIYAIIKGSAVNNDGNKKVGFTAPSVVGQVTCIKSAQKFSKVDPDTISYVEAHGTGTALGDSIEVEALNIAFNKDKSFSCPIGSVKTNIGHLDTAAGVAGLIKTVLSLKNKKIPASLHFNVPNPNINFEDGPFYVNNKLIDWKSKDSFPLRAAVNSFGVGGTNAHVILEEAPIVNRIKSESNFNLLVLSAKTETSLISYFSKLEKFVLEEENLNLSDMCHTYQIGRQNFDKRVSLIFQDKGELLQKLEVLKQQKTTIEKVKNNQSTIVFAFPGQGSQYLNMGKDLYLSNAFFKEHMDKGFDLLLTLTGKNFKEVLYPENDAQASDINNTSLAQPLIFLIEYSLARLLMNYGIRPTCMIGHSIGEYAAACISGLFTFDQTLKIVLKRGELMNSLPKGSMISVPLNELQAREFLNEEISLAAVNGPKQVVFSGSDSAIENLIEQLSEKEIPAIKLHTSHAFHSFMQDSILEEFSNVFKDITFNKIEIPFVSNLSGDFIKNEEEVKSGEYWTKQLRNTVRFSEGVSNFLSDNTNVVFIEVGPGNALNSLLKQHKTDKIIKQASILRSAKVQENDEKYFRENLGTLWTYGLIINWSDVFEKEDRYRISVPTYAFDNITYPAEIDHNKLFDSSPVILNNLENSFYFPSWKRSIINTNKDIIAKSFLVFSDDSHYSKEVISRLKLGNNHVIEVLINDSYYKHSDSKFSIDPLNTETFTQLFNAINALGITISDVIYFWGLTINSSTVELNENNLEFNLIYFCLARIIKTCGKDKNIFVFTNLLQNVIGNEQINSSYSLLLGLIKVMPLENQLLGINVDVDLNDWNGKLLEDIVSEVLNNDLVADKIVSYRLGQRWIQDFQSSVQNFDKKETSKIKKQRSYLITGGLGKLGFAISAYLIKENQANLIILGRSDLNDKNNGSESAIRYQELQKLSNTVKYLKTDVSNKEDIQTLISGNKALFDNINGIIHLAKGDDINLDFIENVSVKQSIKMMEAKVNGIASLYGALKNNDLDFVWMTSSLSATYGTMGLSDYISSNIYLEYFAYGKPDYFKCVQLPTINFDEQNISRQNTVTAHEVIEIFEKSLTIKNTNVIFISKENINQTLKNFNSQSSTISLISNLSSNDKVNRPDLATEYFPARTDVEKELKVIFEDLFEIVDIGIKDDFFELGGDSLRAMVFLKKINKEFDVEISISDFFSYKSIEGVANLIEDKRWLTTANTVVTENELTI